jgi:hypothetical protein
VTALPRLHFAGVVVVGFERVPEGYRGVVRTTRCGGPTEVEFAAPSPDVSAAESHAKVKLDEVLLELLRKFHVVEKYNAAQAITGYMLWGVPVGSPYEAKVEEAHWHEKDPMCPHSVADMWSALGLRVELSEDDRVVTGCPEFR